MDGKILFTGNFDKQDVICSYKEVTSRKIDSTIEKKAKKIWQQKLNEARIQGKKMWDQPVYRLDGNEIKDDICKLEFSTIPFSIRYSIKDFTDELSALGEEYLPMATYSSIFIETTDGLFVFGEKSDKYSTNRKYSYIGGVFNRSEEDDNVDLFKASLYELVEELGITLTDIKQFRLIGAFRTKSFNVAFIFYCKLNITKKEVINKFRENNDLELKDLFFGKRKDVRNIGIDKIGKESEIIDIFEKCSNE